MTETTPEDAANRVADKPSRTRGLKPFPKGVSGNPNGRPKKVQEVKEAAEKNAKAAMDVLVKLLSSEDEKVRIMAANAILDRGIGKPKQAVDVDATVKHDHGSKPVSETAAWVEGVLGTGQDRASEEPMPN